MSRLWKQFLCEMLHQKTLAKKAQIFLVPDLRSQHFRHIIRKPKLQLMASLCSNHSLDLYLPKSLGPLRKTLIFSNVFTASAPRPIQSVSCDVCLFFVVWYLWAKIILPENSDFPILPYLSNWKTEKFS